MSRSRKMSARELETITRTVKALLSDCIAKNGGLLPSDSDYAEAHGIYRTLRDLHFDGADVLWHGWQKWAVDTVKGDGVYVGAYRGPVAAAKEKR